MRWRSVWLILCAFPLCRIDVQAEVASLVVDASSSRLRMGVRRALREVHARGQQAQLWKQVQTALHESSRPLPSLPLDALEQHYRNLCFPPSGDDGDGGAAAAAAATAGNRAAQALHHALEIMGYDEYFDDEPDEQQQDEEEEQRSGSFEDNSDQLADRGFTSTTDVPSPRSLHARYLPAHSSGAPVESTVFTLDSSIASIPSPSPSASPFSREAEDLSASAEIEEEEEEYVEEENSSFQHDPVPVTAAASNVTPQPPSRYVSAYSSNANNVAGVVEELHFADAAPLDQFGRPPRTGHGRRRDHNDVPTTDAIDASSAAAAAAAGLLPDPVLPVPAFAKPALGSRSGALGPAPGTSDAAAALLLSAQPEQQQHQQQLSGRARLGPAPLGSSLSFPPPVDPLHFSGGKTVLGATLLGSSSSSSALVPPPPLSLNKSPLPPRFGAAPLPQHPSQQQLPLQQQQQLERPKTGSGRQRPAAPPPPPPPPPPQQQQQMMRYDEAAEVDDDNDDDDDEEEDEPPPPPPPPRRTPAAAAEAPLQKQPLTQQQQQQQQLQRSPQQHPHPHPHLVPLRLALKFSPPALALQYDLFASMSDLAGGRAALDRRVHLMPLQPLALCSRAAGGGGGGKGGGGGAQGDWHTLAEAELVRRLFRAHRPYLGDEDAPRVPVHQITALVRRLLQENKNRTMI
jgi:hypothetical protein